MTQEVGPALGSALAAYSSADEQTRTLIDIQLGRVHWATRQEHFLHWAGLIFAFVIALAFLSGAVYLISNGHDTAGTILGTVDIVALVTVFISGKRTDQGATSGQ